jgi:hypothetical protein
MYVHNWHHSSVSSILFIYTNTIYNIQYMAHSPCFFSPFADSPLSPLAPLSTLSHFLGTLLAVTGSVHLGLRLLVNWPPLSQPPPRPSPLQIPRTPVTQRLTKTTSGTIRRLLSGTCSFSPKHMKLCIIILYYIYFKDNIFWSFIISTKIFTNTIILVKKWCILNFHKIFNKMEEKVIKSITIEKM